MIVSGIVLGVGLIYAAPGDPDPSFGFFGEVLTPSVNGIPVSTSLGISSNIAAVALQPDGKIVVGTSSNNHFAVIRYCPNGHVDDGTPAPPFGSGCGGPGFGQRGIVTSTFFSNNIEWVTSLAIQPDGKILAVGESDGTGSAASSIFFVMVRYCANGQPDVGTCTTGSPGFQFTNVSGSLQTSLGGGRVTLNFKNFGKGAFFGPSPHVALQSDGKIVVGGTTSTNNRDFAVARFCPSGHLDDGSFSFFNFVSGCGGTGFGNGGIVTTDFGGRFDQVWSIVIQPSDGKIVAVGDSSLSGLSDVDIALARYNPDGSPDESFGNGGKIGPPTFLFPGQLHAVALQSGTIVGGGVTVNSNSSNNSFLIIRFSGSNGSFLSFPTVEGFGNVNSVLQDIKIDRGGEIVTVGKAQKATGDNGDFIVARFCSNGVLDNDTAKCSSSSFHGTGFVTTNLISGAEDFADTVAIQPDSKIVAAGDIISNPNEIGLTRYLGDCENGVLDLTEREQCEINTEGICSVFNTKCNVSACVCMVCGNGIKAPEEECDNGGLCEDGTFCDITDSNSCAGIGTGTCVVPPVSKNGCSSDCKCETEDCRIANGIISSEETGLKTPNPAAGGCGNLVNGSSMGNGSYVAGAFAGILFAGLWILRLRRSKVK
jgi:uncharacterized delta-60 repeat protein